MNKNLITLAIALSLTACGGDDAQSNTEVETDVDTNTIAVISGDIIGSVQEDNTLSATGTLTVVDPDTDEAIFIAQNETGTYGDFTLDTAGAWIYDLDNDNSEIQALNDTETLSDELTITTVDGTTAIVTITITGSDEVSTDAIISGDISGIVTEDNTLTVSGTAIVTDPDTGDDSFIVETISGTYGTLSIDAAGVWIYTLTNTDTTVQALDTGDTLTDDITITTTDGTTETISITIAGTTEPLTSSCTTTGEFNYSGAIATSSGDNIAEELGSKPATNAIDDDLDSTWAGLATIVDGVTTETVALTIKLDDIATITELGLRWDKGDERTTSYMIETSKDNTTWTTVLSQTDSIQQTGAEATEIVALTESIGEYIRLTGFGNSGSGWVSLNDATVSGCATTETSISTNTPATFAGDISGTINSDATNASGIIYISDLDGDAIEVQADTGSYGDFSIDTTGAWAYTLDATTVSSLAEGATVNDVFSITADDDATTDVTITITGVASDTTPAVTDVKMASIVDILGENSTPVGDDSGVLRYKRSFSDRLEQGKVTVSVRNNSTDQDAFFMLYGSSTSTSDAILELRIKKNGGGFEVRGDDNETVSFTAVPVSQWFDIEASWDSSSDINFSQITLTVNGETKSFTSFTELSTSDIKTDDTNESLTAIQQLDYVRTVNFKLANDDGVADKSFDVDNIKVYSDIAGTTIAFETDFEDSKFVVGDDLESDTVDTPFDGSTVQATVESKL